MQSNTLTSNEIKVIKRITKIQLDSLLRVSEKGHPMLEEMLKEYDGEIKATDIAEDQVINVLELEKVLEEPTHIFNLDQYNLQALLYIAAAGICEKKYPKTRKSILTKLDLARQITKN